MNHTERPSVLPLALTLSLSLVGCVDATSSTTGAGGGATCVGADCAAECPTGYARVGDDPCAPTCETLPTCGARRHCEDSSLPARCACDIGYGGTDCGSCAPGFSPDASGACAADPAGKILVTGALGSSAVLFGLDRETGAPLALRTLGDDPMLSPLDAIALDPTSRTIFAARASADGERVGRLDPSSGELAILGAAGSDPRLGPSLSFDTATSTLLSVGPDARLVSIDPVTGVATPGPTIAGEAITSIAFEPLVGDALAVTASGALVRVDLVTGAATKAPLAGAPHATYRGVAVDPDTGHVLLARDRDDGLRQVARRVAIDLGHAEQAAAEPTIVRSSFSPIVRGGSDAGPELILVVHEAAPKAQRTRVTIDARNPGAGIVVWDRSPTEIVVTRDARPAFVAVYSDLPAHSAEGDSLVVEGGAPRPDRPFVHVAPPTGGAPLDASWGAAPDFARAYSARQWSDRRLPPSPSALTYERVNGAIDELDADLSFVRTRTLEAPLYGPIVVSPK